MGAYLPEAEALASLVGMLAEFVAAGAVLALVFWAVGYGIWFVLSVVRGV